MAFTSYEEIAAKQKADTEVRFGTNEMVQMAQKEHDRALFEQKTRMSQDTRHAVVNLIKSGNKTDEATARMLLAMVPGADTKSVNAIISAIQKEATKTPCGVQMATRSIQEEMSVLRKSDQKSVTRSWRGIKHKAQQFVAALTGRLGKSVAEF